MVLWSYVKKERGGQGNEMKVTSRKIINKLRKNFRTNKGEQQSKDKSGAYLTKGKREWVQEKKVNFPNLKGSSELSGCMRHM